ncbi:MAG TPA: ATP synthase subunit I [Armatimonadota bacterium]|nr:ATP synthase subunit I [Armatimonadota bacterium]HPP74758.1 ATP synthase subunit I [Armatimonadota bacterium]
MIDSGFLKRVYRTSVFVWLFALLLCSVFMTLSGAIGISVGFIISFSSLVLLERLVTMLMVPEWTSETKRVLRKLVILAVIKYGVIALTLWLVLKTAWVNPIGLAIGLGLPMAVISLKALGIALTFGPELDRRS